MSSDKPRSNQVTPRSYLEDQHDDDRPSQTAKICSRLEDHEDWEFRQEAAWCLGEVGGELGRQEVHAKIVPVLSKAFCQDDNFAVRRAAARALGRLRAGADVLVSELENLKEQNSGMQVALRQQVEEEAVIALRLDESSDIQAVLCEVELLQMEVSHALEQYTVEELREELRRATTRIKSKIDSINGQAKCEQYEDEDSQQEVFTYMSWVNSHLYQTSKTATTPKTVSAPELTSMSMKDDNDCFKVKKTLSKASTAASFSEIPGFQYFEASVTGA
jgi:hypothetical protein